MRSARLGLILLLTTLTGCCSLATLENMRGRAETAELKQAQAEQALSQAKRDNDELLDAGQKLGEEFYEAQNGMIEQARREIKLRETCEAL